MSEFMREALPIIFMYLCVLGLGPFIAIAMWMAFDGDRLREDEVELPVEAQQPAVALVERDQPAVALTAEATSAA